MITTAPDFILPSTSGKDFCLTNELNKGQIILYFYPRDNTPGCTQQACDFTRMFPAFEDINIQVVGISRDSLASHQKFITAQHLTFPLLADTDGHVCQLYNVLKKKNMYGKQVTGIERTTFLINPDQSVVHTWNRVQVEGHVQEILDFLRHQTH